VCPSNTDHRDVRSQCRGEKLREGGRETMREASSISSSKEMRILASSKSPSLAISEPYSVLSDTGHRTQEERRGEEKGGEG
jgi:hypothetical protein